MADDTLNTAEQAENGSQQSEPKTFTQEEVNGIVQSRLLQERKKYEDYDSLKEKAGKYDESADAREELASVRSELEKLKKADSVRAIREKVASELNITPALLTGEDEESCIAQGKAMLEFFKPNAYPSIKDGGEVTKVGKRSAQEAFADWFAEFNK